jgi:putative hydrolase of the HAD superfamily
LIEEFVEKVFFPMLDPAVASRWSACRWLIFDAVGTLIQPDPPVPVAYQSIAARYGSQATAREVGDRFRAAFRQSELRAFDENEDGNHGSTWRSSDAIEVARWQWIVEQVVPDVNDLEECFRELWDHFAKPSSWVCFHDVETTLSALSQAGFRLAIASNFDSRLHAVCDGHPALKPVERRFVSSETRFRKPAPEFYAAMRSSCDCPAEQILMIGDDLAHDVAGPVAAGMHSVLLDRRATHSESNSINSLEELAVMLGLPRDARRILVKETSRAN